MGTIKATNIEPIADNGTVTLGSSGDNLVLGSGVNNKLLRPAFSVYLNSDQSISNATVTKITLDTETYDTDNAFASNKFTVPSGADGKYCFIATITYVNLTNEDEAQVRIHKNGSFVQGSGYFQGQNGTVTYQATQIINLVAGDYIELHGYQVSGGAISADGGEAYTNLKGFRIGT